MNFEDEIINAIDNLYNDPNGAVDTEKAARALIDEARDFKIVFDSEAGKRVMKRILRFCQFAEPKFKPNKDCGIDPYMTHVIAGMENVAIFIMQRRAVDIPAYEAMIKGKATMEREES